LLFLRILFQLIIFDNIIITVFIANHYRCCHYYQFI